MANDDRGRVVPGVFGDDERVSQGMADVLVHRLFAIGLDLHAALTYLEADLAPQVTVGKIHEAIHGLDGAIRDFRGVVFGLRPDAAPGRAPGLRTLIVEAVERACDACGAYPAITLGHGIEAVLDRRAWQQAAELVHRALVLAAGERMTDAHVVVTADPEPPTRLVMHIDAPAGDLREVAGRLRPLDGHGMDLSCRPVPRSPERSRIRLEWPIAAG